MTDVAYAIGDLHGRYDLMDRMEARISVLSKAIPANAPVVVTIGDYCDEGPDSRQVLARLLRPGFAALPRISLPGNHDVWMVRALTMFRSNTPGWQTWLRHAADSGIGATLRSLGVSAPEDGVPMDDRTMVRVMRGLAAALPAEMADMIKSMPPLVYEAGMFFVHAGLNPEFGINEQDFDDCVMGVPGFWTSGRDFGAPVCVGHRVWPTPYASPRVYGIDTGAAEYGVLTGLIVSGGLPFQFFAVSDRVLTWVPVVVDGGDDPYLSLTRMWWRDVLAASPEPPYLAFDDPARLDAFVASTRIKSFRQTTIAKAPLLTRAGGARRRLLHISCPVPGRT